MPEETAVLETTEETAAPEESGETPSESATDETTPPETPKPEGNLQKRIDRLKREATQAAEKAEYWRNEALKSRELPAPVAEVPKDTGEPKEEDFALAADYVKAVARYTFDQGQKAERERVAREQQEETAAQQQKRIKENLKQFKAANPDFDDVMEDSSFNSSNLLADEMRDSEMPAALLYHFAKNPEDANRIAEIKDARKVAKEVAKIEARIASSAPASKQAPITSTPAPIKPVAASRQSIAKLDQIDDDTEWLKQRNAEIAARRQR